MSERSYWRERPAARAVYERRMEAENASNFRLLSQGISFAAVLFGVFGVCTGDVELVTASAAMAIFAKVIG